MNFLKKAISYTRSDVSKHLAKIGFFTIAVTVVSYWTSFQDRAANRQESAWSTLRASIIWTQADGYRWGNVGQLAAMETLTRHCNAWWRGTFVQPALELIFPDCVDLNSLSLERMELGSLKSAGANLSHSNFACTNLAKADLRQAHLSGANFSGAYMGGADLSGALLEDRADFRLANVSWIQFDDHTKLDPSWLKCACLNMSKGDGGDTYRQIQPKLPSRFSEILQRINVCPAVRNTCEPSVQEQWKCID